MLFGTEKQVIVPQCEGCAHVVVKGDAKYCDAFINPAAKWIDGQCNLANHILRKTDASKNVNPLKASKKAMKGKG